MAARRKLERSQTTKHECNTQNTKTNQEHLQKGSNNLTQTEMKRFYCNKKQKHKMKQITNLRKKLILQKNSKKHFVVKGNKSKIV